MAGKGALGSTRSTSGTGLFFALGGDELFADGGGEEIGRVANRNDVW